jgi:hypothetical protein
MQTFADLDPHHDCYQCYIRIQIRMFLGLPEPDPYPLVQGGVPVRIRIRILISSKNSKKNLDSFCFVYFFSLKNYANGASKSNKQKNFL